MSSSTLLNILYKIYSKYFQGDEEISVDEYNGKFTRENLDKSYNLDFSINVMKMYKESGKLKNEVRDFYCFRYLLCLTANFDSKIYFKETASSFPDKIRDRNCISISNEIRERSSSNFEFYLNPDVKVCNDIHSKSSELPKKVLDAWFREAKPIVIEEDGTFTQEYIEGRIILETMLREIVMRIKNMDKDFGLLKFKYDLMELVKEQDLIDNKEKFLGKEYQKLVPWVNSVIERMSMYQI